MKNRELRDKILSSGLKLWEVADKIGIRGSTLSVWLRYDLTEDKKEKITKAITELKK